MGFVGGLVKQALPALGAAAGTAIGGPLGTVAGGMLGNAISGQMGPSSGGNAGLGYNPQQANILQPVNQGQLSTAYNQGQGAISQQQNFLNALNAQNGIQNQSNVYNQYQGIANGTGPNPALAQLNQSTGQNVANQAALMAGQRGSGANAGLIARQAAMQGGNLQQQAAGQGATLQAQQQLSALGAMGQISGQQVGQQQAGLGQLGNMDFTQQGQLLNGMQGYNQQLVGSQGNVNTIQGNLAQIGAGQQYKTNTGIQSGIAEAASRLFPSNPSNNSNPSTDGTHGGTQLPMSGASPFAQGGMVGPQSKAGCYLKASKGMMVPGKASVSGDSLKNDKVPAVLSPGEIVIPRSILQSADPVNKSAAFVQALLAKQGMRG